MLLQPGPDRQATPATLAVAGLRVRGLTKTFRTTRGDTLRALAQVDLDIARGEFVCIVGPSGCGKTTLLNIVGGLERPSGGSVDFVFPDSSRPQLSIVFQEESVFPWLNVLDNAAFGLMARRRPRAEREQRAAAVLASMGLSRFARAYPRELSGGMRQRVNLARAFANDREVLLMDEPFASLDEQTRLLLQDDLLRVWEDTRQTVVFITHSIDEAIRLADRIVVMSARPGRIIGEIAVGLERPRDVFALQTDPRFLGVRARVWDALKREVLAARVREQP